LEAVVDPVVLQPPSMPSISSIEKVTQNCVPELITDKLRISPVQPPSAASVVPRMNPGIIGGPVGGGLGGGEPGGGGGGDGLGGGGPVGAGLGWM